MASPAREILLARERFAPLAPLDRGPFSPDRTPLQASEAALSQDPFSPKLFSSPLTPLTPPLSRPGSRPWTGNLPATPEHDDPFESLGPIGSKPSSSSGLKPGSAHGMKPGTPLGMKPGTPLVLKPSSSHGQRLHGAARRSLLNCQRIASILKNFKFFQDMEPSIQQKLPTIATHVKYPAETMMFRQGDPPGNCYAILSGEVGIYVRSEEEDDMCDSARGIQTPAKRLNTPLGSRGERRGKYSNMSDMDSQPWLRRRSRSLTCVELQEDIVSLSMRKKTAEGFSFYHSGSALGKQVGVFGPGKLIGELALLQSQPRSATITCLKDTEFLVISRRAFDQVLKDDIKRTESQKIDFLCEHVPGMRDLPPPKEKTNKPHASYFFKKGVYGKDHEFLSQGTASDDTIFVVFNGAVEFRRYETSWISQSPSPTLGRRPRKTPLKCWTPKPTDPKGGKMMSIGREEHGARCKDTVRKMGILLTGGLFGSLPFPEPEPFTVVALSSPCEVLYCSGSDMAKLPRTLVSTIQEYLSSSVTWRLARLQSGLIIEEEQEQAQATASSGHLVPLPDKAKRLGLSLVQAGKLHPNPSLYKQQKGAGDGAGKKYSSSYGALPAVADALPRSGTMSSSTSALPSARMSSHSGASGLGPSRPSSGNHPADSPAWI